MTWHVRTATGRYGRGEDDTPAPPAPAATSHVLAPPSMMQQAADVPGDDAVWRVGAYPDTRMSLTDTGAAAAYDESIPN